MKRTLYLHIGLERTGTTSFQYFCVVNKDALLQQSVLYPMDTTAFAVEQNMHAPLAGSYLPPAVREFFQPEWVDDRGEQLRSLKAAIEASPAAKILISSEHFVRLVPEEIAQLRADFADYDCKIVVGLRDVLARLRSAHASSVAFGSHVTFDDYVSGFLDPLPGHSARTHYNADRYLRASNLIRDWSAVFGVYNFLAFSSDRRDSTRQIFELVEPAINRLIPPSPRDNESMTPAQVERMRLVNKKLPTYEELSLSGRLDEWPEINLQRQAVHQRILKGPRDAGRKSGYITSAHAQRLDEIRRHDRLWLIKNFGIDIQSRRSAPAEKR